MATSKPTIALADNFDLDAPTIAQLRSNHWQIVLFFKWIKQRSRIKAFYGISPHAVKMQM